MNELEENQQTVKKSGFGRGLIFGVIAGLSIAILAGVVLLNVFYHKGFCLLYTSDAADEL